MAPHKPTNLLATAPSVLLYAASSETGDSVFALDLNGTQPKPVGEEKRRFEAGRCGGSYDMCAVGGASDQLIVAAHGVHGAHAFSTTSGRLAWRVTEQTYGMDRNIDLRGVPQMGRVICSSVIQRTELRFCLLQMVSV